MIKLLTFTCFLFFVSCSGEINKSSEDKSSTKKGFDITAEFYPYTAESTLLNSAMFNDGWQRNMSIGYVDLQ